MRPIRCFAALCLASLCLAAVSRALAIPGAQTSATQPTAVAGTSEGEALTESQRMAVIEKVGALLQERYVFPDLATKCVEHLCSELASGTFNDTTAPELFGQQLTDALFHISQDKHLVVRLRREEERLAPKGTPHPLRNRKLSQQRNREKNFGFERVERLDGNVGYLDLRYFAHPADAMDTAAAAMAFLEHTDALIFDLRRNGGGHPGMVHFLCSYLFAEPTHLNSFYYREGARTEDYWTLPGVPGTVVPDVPVFVLTSGDTFSGAEEFSYNLLTQERGTLVGETTRGGANPGQTLPVDEQFEVFIPIGRAINPITGTNWEGTGVQPHVAVDREQALEAALELARPAAEAYRAQQRAPWTALEAAHRKALELDDQGWHDEAAQVLSASLPAALGTPWLKESDVNAIGYDLLGQQRSALALAAFGFNVEHFPESGNAHDSYGEALRAAGDLRLALEHYQRSLQLDPSGRNAEAARAIVAELKAALLRPQAGGR